MNPPSLGFVNVRVVAISVVDLERANQFYSSTLGLPPAYEDNQQVGHLLGETILMLKPDSDQPPTLTPNPRVTIQVKDARKTESDLRSRGVTIADAIQVYDKNHLVGSFLDSEGNKMWFCSYA
jgi:catechol 2,3-dioxygenase-like lactoylglutathione lyase family enzyme